MASGIEARAAVPYGPLGLVLSLVCGIVLTAIYAAVFVGALALAYAALFGWSDMLAAARTLQASGAGRNPSVVVVGYAAGIALYLAMAAASLSLARFRGGAEWRGLVAWQVERQWWRDRRYWALVAAAIVYSILASVVLSKFYPPSNSWFTLPPGPAGLLLSFLLVVVAAPVSEELLFRGWIYTSLRSRLEAGASVTISALLFALAHYENTHLYALAVLPVGLILGIARERAGTFWATANLHALFNFCAWLTTALGSG
jgi:membrane protease YdiL (CAAX protease family)